MSAGLQPTPPARRVRVLVLADVWPHVQANTEGATVALHEILLHLTSSPEFEVAFVRTPAGAEETPPAARDALRVLETRGLTVLPEVSIVPPPASGRLRRIVSRYIAAKPADLLPGAANAPDIRARCDAWRADCALTVFSNAATAGLFEVPVPRMAYYGNLDHRVAHAQYAFDWSNRPRAFDPRLMLATIKARIGTTAVKRAHLRVMRTFDDVAEVSANDAEDYRRHGVRADYLRNMWPSGVTPDWEDARDEREQAAPLKIVGNVGNLGATGNTQGLHTLATQVLPALKRTLGEGAFEIHVFGGRQPHRYVTPLLRDPHIRIRGFVEDLAGEILSAPVYLVANNYSEFKVSNTRFLHAWSLGACVVAFQDSALAMPEIGHRRNALLAATPGEMAALVAEAGGNRGLRRSLGRAGAQTVASEFDPASITRQIADRLIAIAGRAR